MGQLTATSMKYSEVTGKLPELGPVGANGLAHPRDFINPFASFDIDDSAWTGNVHTLPPDPTWI